MARSERKARSKEQAYAIVHVRTDPRHCQVEVLGDLEDRGDLNVATSIAHRFPKGLAVDLAADGGEMITDFINNICSILIVSEKAKAILVAEGVSGADQVEYLPIALRDKKRKKIKEPFYIVNLLKTVACLDWDRSDYSTFEGTREIIMVNVLHILPAAIPGDLKLFRLKECMDEIIIRQDLLERLKKEGCDGLNVWPIGQKRPL